MLLADDWPTTAASSWEEEGKGGRKGSTLTYPGRVIACCEGVGICTSTDASEIFLKPAAEVRVR